MKPPKTLLAVPKVARCHEIHEKAVAEHRRAELEFNRVSAAAPPACVEPFDEAEAARRLARAQAHDTVHGSSEAGRVAAEIATERNDRSSACAKSERAAAEHREVVERARLDLEAAYAVLYSARGALQAAIEEAAPAILEAGSRAAYAAAEALFQDAEELRLVKLAAAGGPAAANVPAAHVEATIYGLRIIPANGRAKKVMTHSDAVRFE